MIPVDLDLRLISTPLSVEEKVAVCPVADVKVQARISHNDEDTLIESYIVAAYDFLSGPHGWLGGYCILQEDWEWFAPSSGVGAYLELPLRPIAFDDEGVPAISAFEWVQSGATYDAVSASLYHALPSGTFPRIARVSGYTWPYFGVWHPRAYRVEFTAGAADKDSPEDVPAVIVQMIKILAGHWYRNREAAGEVTPEIVFGMKALAARVPRIGPDHS